MNIVKHLASGTVVVSAYQIQPSHSLTPTPLLREVADQASTDESIKVLAKQRGFLPISEAQFVRIVGMVSIVVMIDRHTVVDICVRTYHDNPVSVIDIIDGLDSETKGIIDRAQFIVYRPESIEVVSFGAVCEQYGLAKYVHLSSIAQPEAVSWPTKEGWYWAHGRIAGMAQAKLMSARAMIEGDKIIVYVGEAMTHRLSFPDPELPLRFKPAVLPTF